ncbi:MAG: UDP-2,3-diacylglucosamine diphosphatase [Gammaproteobacteria bacterium]|nr:UDP-2,3-diacylglucosamine diphosphatase [Gammaproteobacteria bacterium]
MNHPHSVLISDLHLSEGHPETTTLFFKFLEEKAQTADTLYILGDFFEFWIGDDDLSDYHLSIIHALAALNRSGVKVFIMHGNRDFILGKKFAALAGANLLKDPSVVDFYGHRVLLTHGDQLCTDDIRYQRYRRVANLKWVQALFLLLPLAKRRALAKKIHDSNPHRKPGQYRAAIADVTLPAVEKAFNTHGIKDIIHGHTHKMDIHHYPENKRRFVMSDWHETGSYIEINEQGIMMHSFP